MNNKFVFSILLFSLLSVGCAKQQPKNREDKPEDVIPADTEVTAENIADDHLKEFPSYFLRKISSFDTYKAVTAGHTDAYIFGIKIEQSIDVTVLRDEYSYLINESHSTMVNTVHVACFSWK